MMPSQAFALGLLGFTLLSTCFPLVPTSTSRQVLSSFDDNGVSSRRIFGCRVVEVLGGTAAFLEVDSAVAKGSQEVEDKQKIYKGYQRLNYLIDNWVQETTVCGNNDNPYIGEKGCERTPLKVMEYMGYKNTNDPLFKADKTLQRLEALVPPDNEDAYIDAVEKWTEKADEASTMSFVSSWGAANPGGGEDRVQYFIERAKKDVMVARDSLKTVVTILQIAPS